MESKATDKPVPREIKALVSEERLILRERQRAAAPFGGIAVFISFLGKIGLVEAARQHMPVRWRWPNHIGPSGAFTAFPVSVLVGARRLAHASGGGRKTRIPLLDSISNWQVPTSPKLEPVLQT